LQNQFSSLRFLHCGNQFLEEILKASLSFPPNMRAVSPWIIMPALAAGLGGLSADYPEVGKKVCKDSSQAAGPCTVNVHGCSGVYKWKVKFEATATDAASGKVGGSMSDHYDSATGAGTHAVYDLLTNQLTSTPTSDDCSCYSANTPFGKCTFRGAICAMFNSTEDVTKGADGISYKAFAWDLNNTNCSGAVRSYASPQGAGAAAAKVLLSACPALLHTCGNKTTPAQLPHEAAWARALR
jgi:hypothetical protein